MGAAMFLDDGSSEKDLDALLENAEASLRELGGLYAGIDEDMNDLPTLRGRVFNIVRIQREVGASFRGIDSIDNPRLQELRNLLHDLVNLIYPSFALMEEDEEGLSEELVSSIHAKLPVRAAYAQRRLAYFFDEATAAASSLEEALQELDRLFYDVSVQGI
jgi:hypothetical protein